MKTFSTNKLFSIVPNFLSKEIEDFWMAASIEELTAHFVYINVANIFQNLGFFGAQKYFEGESTEELKHYFIVRDYVNDRGGLLSTPETKKVLISVSTIEEGLDVALKLETELLTFYEKGYRLCSDMNDFASTERLHEFIRIQRESIGEISDLQARYNRTGNSPAAILEFDEYLGEK